MLLEHRGKRPQIHPSVYIAPNATLSGDVTLGENSHVLFGAVITADGGPVVIGTHCVVMENAVLRGTPRHSLKIGDNVLIGPRAYLSGCTVDENAFLATGVAIFNGAYIQARAEVRINGVVHINTVVLPDTTVPIGWVAVGDPAQLFPPDKHEEIWAIQEKLDFPGTVFGLARVEAGESIMPEMMRRYTRALGKHLEDRLLDESS